MKQLTEDEKKIAKGMMWFFGIVFLLALVSSCVDSSSGSSSSSLITTNDTTMRSKAYAAVETEIEEGTYLKSPSTADFQSVTSITFTRTGDYSCYIKAYVDAENGFGATVRTYFSATVTFSNSTGSRYTISNLNFE